MKTYLFDRERVKTDIFNAYRGDVQEIRKDVMKYVNMVVGADKIDEKYVNSVETRLGLRTEQRKSFRDTVRAYYKKRVVDCPDYDFMDQRALVMAVADVRFSADIAEAGSLGDALTNRTSEANLELYNRMIDTLVNKMGYLPGSAAKAIVDYFCKPEE